ncbi:MAG: sorbosone dehydrogenase family protein [Saprospiraceae bacterium]|nr:sorbosone dehydrogenase family protein [Saprospiraceae bacterium]
MQSLKILFLLLGSLSFYQCSQGGENTSTVNAPNPLAKKTAFKPAETKLPLHTIKLPEGFKIDVFAEDVKNARSLCLSPNGVLFVGTRSKGNVYALVDEDGDFHADKQYLLAKDLNMPNGVAFKDGDLYVAEVSRILKFENIEKNLANPPKPVVVYDQYPEETHHGWKYIAFGPDGKLYVPVGAPCNICNPEEEIYCSITSINPDGTDRQVVQHGIRNTVGFDWHPVTGDLWFTDNGRDWMGDDMPACELNRASRPDMHFGYPFCHQGNLPDPEFGKLKDCSEFTAPVQNLGPHVAPLGIEFYTGNMFPKEYKNQPLFAEHGSWNRSTPIGYRVMMVKLNDQYESEGYVPFAEGWLQGTEPWGRPVDLEMMPDGSMLVSDDFADVVYRIYYDK